MIRLVLAASLLASTAAYAAPAASGHAGGNHAAHHAAAKHAGAAPVAHKSGKPRVKRAHTARSGCSKDVVICQHARPVF